MSTEYTEYTRRDWPLTCSLDCPTRSRKSTSARMSRKNRTCDTHTLDVTTPCPEYEANNPPQLVPRNQPQWPHPSPNGHLRRRPEDPPLRVRQYPAIPSRAVRHPGASHLLPRRVPRSLRSQQLALLPECRRRPDARPSEPLRALRPRRHPLRQNTLH